MKKLQDRNSDVLCVASERGVAIVEFALIVPVLIIFMAIVADVGLLLRQVQSVTHAAREGARIAAVTTVEDPAQPCLFHEQKAKVAAEQILRDAGLGSDEWTVNVSVADTIDSKLVGAEPELQLVTVSVSRVGSPMFSISKPLLDGITVKSTFSLYNRC